MSKSKEVMLAPRCKKCILSSYYTELREGLCADCSNEHACHSVQQDSSLYGELIEFLHAHSGVGRSGYDALVLYSGGKDSFFLLKYLRSTFPKLRLLGLFIDNHFVSPITEQSMKMSLKGIDIPIVRYSPSFALVKKIFRHCFLHYDEGNGGYLTVDRADGEIIFDIARHFAARLKIPSILSGLSPVQCEDIIGVKSYVTAPSHNTYTRTTIASYELSSIFAEIDYDFWWDSTLYDEESIPQLVFPLYALPYNEHVFQVSMEDELSLSRSSLHPLLSNHALLPVIIALDYVRYNYCSFEPEFARLIRRGESDREVWLDVFQSAEHLSREGRFLPRTISDTLSMLDLSPADIGLPWQDSDSYSSFKKD